MKNKVKQEIIDIVNLLQLYHIHIYPKDSLQRAKEKIQAVDWTSISRYGKKLSEDIIREFQDEIDWWGVSEAQFLSEEFIREFKYKVVWNWISETQILSEDFIDEFPLYVVWENICKYQILSEKFIRKCCHFHDRKIDLQLVAKYQRLSPEFIKEFKLTIPETCSLYTPNSEKLKYIKENTSYEIIDDKFIIAYKSVRNDMRSSYKPFHFLYEVGKEYESHCDCNIDNENSFGLSAWTKEGALRYLPSGTILKVRINIDDLGCILRRDAKIRCRKLTVLEIMD